jgi:acetyl esterase/lipase
LALALACTLTLAAGRGALGQEPADAPKAKAEPADPFKKFDRDGDGRLSRDEAPEAVKLNFDRIDSNRDGFLSIVEIGAFLRRVQRERMPTPPPVAESIQLVADVPYADTANPRQRLDLLLPKRQGEAKPLPVVVFIHGGAWLGGDRLAGYVPLSPFLVSGEYAGVTVGYRLSSEAIWPAQIHDVKAAVRWVRANAGKYNLDPERIGVIGPSAGGHLAAMLGTSGGVKELEGDLGPHKDVSSRVACVVDEFGPSDLPNMGKAPSRINHEAPEAPEGRLIGGAVGSKPEVARAASPITYVSPDDPPFLIVHGTKDDMVPFEQSKRLHEALQKAGVPSTFIPVEGGGHGGFRNSELPRRTKAFFDKHLLGRDAAVSDSPVIAGPPPAEAKKDAPK